MLIVPYEQIGSLIAWDFVDSLLDVIARGVTVALVAMLGVTLWLLRRVHSFGSPAPIALE